MEQIQFDSGVKEYRLNGQGVLRFHPGDPNLYARFFEAMDKIQALAEKMTKQGASAQQELSGRDAVALMEKTDREVKKILNWTFGLQNDFDEILGGINLMAVADNGQQIITNLLAALEPILMEGAQQCTKEQVQGAVALARKHRDAR